jgi:hypothetical protein
MFSTMSMSKHMIGLPFLASLNFATTDVTSTSSLAQDKNSLLS